MMCAAASGTKCAGIASSIPLTVLIDDKVAKAIDHPEMMRVIEQIVGEVAAVAAADESTARSRHGG